jgi:HNH endonuclease
MPKNVKLSQDKLDTFCEINKIQLIDVSYTNNSTKHLWLCKVHNEQHYARYDKLQQGRLLKCCSHENKIKKSIIRAEKIAYDNNLVFHKSTFIDASKRNKWTCKIHEKSFDATVNGLWQIVGYKCPDCRNDNPSIDVIQHLTEEKRKWLKNKQLDLLLKNIPNIEFRDIEFCGMDKTHTWFCKIHNFETTSCGTIIKRTKRLKCCRWAENTGLNHPHYDKNVPEEIRVKDRRYDNHKRWARQVKERDDYKCVICKYNQKLVAHHLYSYLSYPDLRHDVNNGVTLCTKCHVEFHKIYGKTGNIKEQFAQYKLSRIAQ